MIEPYIKVQSEDFNSSTLINSITDNRTDIGAIVSFTGLCRDEDGRLNALELEHYPGMAEKQLTALALEASQRWPFLQALTIIHRYGIIAPGEQIVFVATAAKHRQSAFEAANFLMDYLKTDAPFWKKEHIKQSLPSDHQGTSTLHGWVTAKVEDDLAKSRWQG